MESKDEEKKRTDWLTFVIIANFFEIAMFSYLGMKGLSDLEQFNWIFFFIIAGSLIFVTIEVINYNYIGKQGGIILFLALGFSFRNPLAILFAFQLYVLAFDESTINLFEQ
ncbi:MAG: hypothetical protein HeimC2_20320 [Candidatus Heimdallarchaeota archaeon LC_2]|nr:MAG: hypothetical protein HeimC2_20320 [Candidatus Heimdallarchaeota archaeon LC_2]